MFDNLLTNPSFEEDSRNWDGEADIRVGTQGIRSG